MKKEKIVEALGRTTDGFRNYFAGYVSKLIDLADKLEYELTKHDEPIISISDDVDDSDWVWEDDNDVDFEDGFALIDIDDWHNDEEISNNKKINDDLSSTAYKEFTKDEVILYSRGFGGEIGRDAIVIIDVPLNNNINVIEKCSENKQSHFNPSGLQGLNGKVSYVINPQNIVGYVDKLNKKIVFNPKYRKYEKYTKIGRAHV